MTATNTKTKPSGRTKSAVKKAPAEGKTVTLPMPDTDSEEEASGILSKTFPDWDKLDKDERAELSKLVLEHRKRGSPVKIKLIQKPTGGYNIDTAGKSLALDILKLHRAFAANSIDPINARASELIKYLDSVGMCHDDRYNAALSFIESMAPQNQAEALLLVQMYVTHDAAIRALSNVGSAEWVPQMQTFGNLAAKLLRISQGQMETWSRMRRGGEQVVRHIHVDNRGGQAVIADQFHNQAGAQENGKTADQSLATGAAGVGTALPGPDPFGNGVSVTESEREAALSDAWRN